MKPRPLKMNLGSTKPRTHTFFYWSIFSNSRFPTISMPK
jgi:hypothetical protein